MNNTVESDKIGLKVALTLAQNGNIDGARIALGLAEQFTDAELLDGLISLSKGLECFANQQHVAALEPLQKALPIVDASNDDDVKSLTYTLINVADGLNALFSGDAHRATELLNIGTDAAERIAFFVPDFEVVALSLKAASLIALAKTHLNASNVTAAEQVFGRVKQNQNILLNKLDPDNNEHILYFAEVYGTRFELALMFIGAIDLATLDLSMFRQRLETSRGDIDNLEKILNNIPEGPIRSLLASYPHLFSALEDLYQSLEIITLHRRPFNKDEVFALVDVDKKLYRARQLAELSADRARGALFHITQLEKLQQNLLVAAKAATKDFGRFSGIVALVCLIVLIIVIHLTIKPTGYVAITYFFGGLIVSLIGGFGFGALRFQPLLKVFSNAIREK